MTRTLRRPFIVRPHLFAVLTQKFAEQPRHHLRRNRASHPSRPLVQTHQERAEVHDFQRDGKVVGIGAELREFRRGHDAFGELRQHAKRDLVIRQAGERREFIEREAWKLFRKIEAAIRRLSLQRCLAQVNRRRLSVRGMKLYLGHLT